MKFRMLDRNSKEVVIDHEKVEVYVHKENFFWKGGPSDNGVWCDLCQVNGVVYYVECESATAMREMYF